MSFRLPGPLVDARWLDEHRGAVRIVDTRWYLDGRSGRAAYDAGHVPGAVWADVDHDLSGPPTPEGGRHPLPVPDAFAAAMGRLGIANGDTVVAYDDAGGSIAARLWWMLRQVGTASAVLDGGLAAWTGPLERGASLVSQARFEPRPWPVGATAGTDEVDRLRLDPAALLLDARSAERYRGQGPSIDARPGHVPGARSIPWAGNLDPESGRFLPPAALRERYAGPGGEPAAEVVASCGSGVTACHDLLALELAGLPTGRLYVGSFSAWSADAARPVARGAEPDERG